MPLHDLLVITPVLSAVWQDKLLRLKWSNSRARLGVIGMPCSFFQGSGGNVTLPLICHILYSHSKNGLNTEMTWWSYLIQCINMPVFFSWKQLKSEVTLYTDQAGQTHPHTWALVCIVHPRVSAGQPSPRQSLGMVQGFALIAWAIWTVWIQPSWSGGGVGELQGSNLRQGSSSLGQRAEPGSLCPLLNPKLFALSALKGKMLWFILWHAFEFKSLIGLWVFTKKNSWCCPSF